MPATFDRKQVYAGCLFNVERIAWIAPQGGERIERDVVRHPGAVLIVPLLANDRLVLIRNHRVAVGETLWEFPAGTAEPDEPRIDTARRELIEEAGYSCGAIEPIGRFYTSPGFADEDMDVFLATELEQVGQQLEPHEQIEVDARSRDEVMQMIADGSLRDGKSIAAIALLEQFERARRPVGDCRA